MKHKNLITSIMIISLLLCLPNTIQTKDIEKTFINKLEAITLGGVKQWVLIRGKDSNPILLFLHGGPGFPQMPFTHIDSKELEKHFLVVNWDQRGSGKSYNPRIKKKNLNVKQLLSDTYELIQILKKRFFQKKIFLIGHSWGSILGLKIAKKYPDSLYAYIGMGQVVHMKEGELLSYKYTLKRAKENENDIKLLKKMGPPSNWQGNQNQNRMVQRQLLAKYGGTFTSISYPDLYRFWMGSPYYSQLDKKNLMKAFIFVQKNMFHEMMEINFFKEIPELKIPVYLFCGKNDFQTPSELVERYFRLLKAPSKEIIWYNYSGHYPNLEEPELYQKKLINIALNLLGLN